MEQPDSASLTRLPHRPSSLCTKIQTQPPPDHYFDWKLEPICAYERLVNGYLSVGALKLRLVAKEKMDFLPCSLNSSC